MHLIHGPGGDDVPSLRADDIEDRAGPTRSVSTNVAAYRPARKSRRLCGATHATAHWSMGVVASRLVGTRDGKSEHGLVRSDLEVARVQSGHAACDGERSVVLANAVRESQVDAISGHPDVE